MLKIFLDDQPYLDERRTPPSQEWTIAKNFREAVLLVQLHGFPCEVSFDHDIPEPDAADPGACKTGYDFAKYLVELDMDTNSMPSAFTWRVHSRNGVGAENIDLYLAGYMRQKS